MKFTPFKDKSTQTLTGSFVFDRRETVRDSKYNAHAENFIAASASGSNTLEIDTFRQGINVTSDKFRYQGTLFKIDSGNDNFVVDNLNFGNSSIFPQTGPFKDKASFENVGSTDGLLALVEGKINSGAFSSPGSDNPVIQADKGYILGDLLDGAAEVFPIRFKAFRQKIFSRSLTPVEGDLFRGVKGSIGEGNSVRSLGNDRVFSLIPLSINSTNTPFKDAGGFYHGPGAFYNNTSSYVEVPSLKHQFAELLKSPTAPPYVPFDEVKFLGRSANRKEYENIVADIRDKVLANTAISGSSEIYPPPGFKSATTGFIFTNKGVNVDSLAYGGLDNDA